MNSTGKINITINDLTDKKYREYYNCLIRKHINILNKYFSVLEISFLKDNFFSQFIMNVPEINTKNYLGVTSLFAFSGTPIHIPYGLNILSEILVENKESRKGIFRVNSPLEKVNSLLAIINSVSKGEIDPDIGAKIIRTAFDMYDISESYKTLFRRFNCYVIPRGLVPLLLKVHKITDPEDKKICAKILLSRIPRNNRMILENCAYICNFLGTKYNDNDQQMNIQGLGVVMMPNLITINSNSVHIEAIKSLSDFTSYLFDNFEELIRYETYTM